MIKTVSIVCSIWALLMVCSCKKGPGEGGNSSVYGTVNTILYSNSAFIDPIDTFPAADEDVFIIYGDDVSFGDKTQTNYEGKFEFKYLREGSYKIYVYSKGPRDVYPSGDYAVIKGVDINGKKKNIDAGLFEIMDE
ncbi:MAG TPA: hypothetical protein PKN75_13430 [Bacteroidia bacterium]|nr:hypothetical protein [Bacteroidia bacterium]HNU34584.1 hypothetical protein [Bacteroidia bacterium]